MPDAGVEQLSKLTVYSIGIVAANKALDSFQVEVYPQETLPDNSGEIAVTPQTLTAKAADAKGGQYEASTTVGSTILAEWIPIGMPNRMTAPDVRRGEMVMLYRFGDAKKFYWATLQADLRFRKLETVVFAFSGTAKESDAVSLDNTYYLEISTHKGLIHFHTSIANKEACGYDIQLNTADGIFTFIDTEGNSITLNSMQEIFRVVNKSGSVMDITKKIFSLDVEEQINMSTNAFTLKANNSASITTQQSTVKATTHDVTAQTNIVGNTSMTGALAQTGGASGSGAAFGGEVKVTGLIHGEADIDLSGTITAGHIVTPSAIDAPNVN